MAELTVPTLGMDMQEATIVRWLVEEGDEVEKGDPVLEIDTDKSSFEVESPKSGVIRNLTGSEGETLPVGSLLAHVLAPGEEPPETPDQETPDQETPDQEGPDSKDSTSDESAQSAHEPATDSSDGTTKSRKVRASPAARRAAAERDLDLEEMPGSGPNGRVYLSDVVGFEAPRDADKSSEGTGDGSITGVEGPGLRREPLTQTRRIGGERTQKSFSEVPHFYLHRDLDADRLVELRERLTARLDPAPSLNDLVSFAVSRALQDHPRLNARYDSGDLLINERVNLGVAASTERGLVVPVLEDAAGLRLFDFAARMRQLLEKARAGRLGRDELSGGTFTVSNLGMMGVDSFDAVINQPEAAILAVGSLRTIPDWDGENWVPKRVLACTLSVDHRVADGADGARFLATLQSAVTDWELLL